MLRLNIRHIKNFPWGEYGRQRTSTKFHDLVFEPKVSKLRVPETKLFQALSHGGKF